MLLAGLERKREELETLQKLDDLRAGKIAAAIHNTMGGGTKVWAARDFFPSLRPPVPAGQSDDEIVASVEAWNTLLGGRDLRKRAS